MSLLTTYAQNIQQQEFATDPNQIKETLKKKLTSKIGNVYSSVYTKVTGVSAEEKEAALKIAKGTASNDPDAEAAIPKTGFDLITKLVGNLGEQLGIANELTSVLAPLAKDLYKVTESPLLATLAGGLIEKGYKQELDQRAKLIQKANATLEVVKSTSLYIGSVVGHWFSIAKEHIIDISQHFISSVDDFFANILTNTGPLAPIMKIMYPYVKSFVLSTFKVSKALIGGLVSKVGKELFGTFLTKFLKPKGEDKLKTITGKVMSIEKTLQTISQSLNFLHESGFVEIPEELRKGIQTAVEASKDPIKAFNEALDRFSKSENEKVANAAFKLKEIVNNKKFKAVAAVTGLGAFVGASALSTEESNKQTEKKKLEEKQVSVLEGIRSGIQDLKSAFSKEVNYSDEVQKKKSEKSESILQKLLKKVLGKQNAARVDLISKGVKKIIKSTFGYIFNLGKTLLGGLASTIAQHPILSLLIGGTALKFDWVGDIAKVAAVSQGILKFTTIGSKFKNAAAVKNILKALGPVSKMITPVMNVIRKIMPIASKMPVLGSVLSKFFPLLGRLVPGLGWILLAFDVVKGVKWVVDKVKEFGEPIGNVVKGIGEKISSFFEEIGLFISDPLGYIAVTLGIDIPEFKPTDIMFSLLSVLNPFALAFKLLPDRFKEYITNLLKVIKKKLISALEYIPFVGDKLKKYFEEKMKEEEQRAKESKIPKPQLVSPTIQPTVTQSSHFERAPTFYTPMQRILQSRVPSSHYRGSTKIPEELKKGSVKEKLLAMLRKSETRTFKGDYSSAHELKDGAGITFGAYQFTEGSGSLQKFIKEYAARTKDDSLLKAFNMYKQGKLSKQDMMAMLRRIGSTDISKKIQDELAYNEYILPAIRLAAKKGITDPKIIAMIIDHALNTGLGGVMEMLRYAPDFTPEGIAKARKEHYRRIAIRKHKWQYYKGWLNRVDKNLSTTNALFKDNESIQTSKPKTIFAKSDKQSIDILPIGTALSNESGNQSIQSSKTSVAKPKEIPKDAISKYLDKIKRHSLHYDTNALIYMKDIMTELKETLPEDSDLYDDVEDLADILDAKVQVTKNGVSVQFSEDDIKEVVSEFDRIMKKLRSSDKWKEAYEKLRSAELVPAQTSSERFEDIARLSESAQGRLVLENLYGTKFLNPYSSLDVSIAGSRLSESTFVTRGESLPIDKFVDTVPLNEYGEVLRELATEDSPESQKLRERLLTVMQTSADVPLSKADPELAKSLKQIFKGNFFSTLQVTSNMAKKASLPEQFTHHEITPDELKTLSDKQLVIHKIRTAKTPEELNELVQKFWPGYTDLETIRALPEKERDKLKQSLIDHIEYAVNNAKYHPDEDVRKVFSKTSKAIKPYASKLRAAVNKNVSDMQHKAQEKAIQEKRMQKEAVRQGVKEATTNNTNAAIVNTNKTAVNPTIINNNTVVNNSSVNNNTVHANNKPHIAISE